jgi:GNAT superfamily N-acetyltransferase
MGVETRRATPDDAVELTRLREIMLATIGPITDRSWWDPCVAAFRERLADPHGEVQAFVVDAPDQPGVLAASSIGVVHYRLPGPQILDGRAGYLMSVATDPRYRRRGYGRAAVEATLDWFMRCGIDRVDLHASEEGDPLYRQLGFHPPHGVAMTRWASRLPANG